MVARPLRPVVLLAVVVATALLSSQDVRVQVAGRTGSRRVVGPGSAAVDNGYRPDARLGTQAPAVAVGGAGPQLQPAYVPDEVIVKFSGGGVVSAAQRRAATTLGVRAVEYPPFTDFALLKLDADVDPAAVAAELGRRPDVDYAQPSYLRRSLFVPDDPFFPLQWNLSTINMERAWDINPGATQEIVVAVIDSGVAFEDIALEYAAGPFTLSGVPYPSLGLITVPFSVAPELDASSRFVAPFDFIWGDEHPVDMSGHGTHVTGTVGQLTNNAQGVAGVAFNVRIMPLKVLGDVWDLIFGATSVCCGATDADVAVAIGYAVEFGAQVINMSLGGPGASPVIDEAVRMAVSEGVFVAIAGGNTFEEGNPAVFPAASAVAIDGAMSVGAIDRQRRRAYYSSTGSWVEIVAPGGEQREEGATGGVLQQTLDEDFALTYERPPALYGPPRFDVMNFTFAAGTSIAAPHVAGLAALLMSQGITNPAAIEAALKHFATDLGEPGRDDEFGHGLVNAPATLRGLGIAR